MRADSSILSSLVQQAETLTNRQSQITRELSSGSRLLSLSDDPRAAAATVRISSSIAQAASAASVISGLQSRLQMADTALGAVVSRLTSAVSLAVNGANDTQNGAERASIANQLSAIRDSVLTLANSSYEGSYLFAGTSNGGAPFSINAATGAVTYTGDSNGRTIAVQDTAIEVSRNGDAIFGDGPDSIFARLQAAIGLLSQGSTLSANQVAGLHDGLQTVIAQRSALGASASSLESTRTYTAAQQTNLEADRSSLASSDPVALATELSATQTQRSALLSSLALLGKGSLFDYL